MIGRIVMAGAALAMAGCTPVEFRGDAGPCKADGANGLIGKPFNDALGKQVLRRTGAKTLRHLPPGAVMTMDYRVDRANVNTDENGIVTKINCG